MDARHCKDIRITVTAFVLQLIERLDMSSYTHMYDLVSGHNNAVNCISFSPDARYLASGSEDKKLIIWKVDTGKIVYRLLFNAPIRCLLWHPIHTETIICGIDDGILYEAKDFSPVRSG